MDTLLKKALTAKRESKFIEFKQAFDVASARDWCEVIKDIVAIANTGGGVILFGVDDSGKVSGFDVQEILSLDPADITSKIYKYTGWQFSDFEITEQLRETQEIAALHVQGIPIPIVFTKPGTYDIGVGRQKTAFSAGTIYFRHGAKSEPGNTEDIRKAIERQLESIRKDWLRGVRKVVTAPQGSQVILLPSQKAEMDPLGAARVRVVDDPSAPAIRLTRDGGPGAGMFLHEELSDGLFDEINNVLNANTLLARGGVDRFVLGHQVYFRVYAERQHVSAELPKVRLLAETGLQVLYGPVLYWLLLLPVTDVVGIIRAMAENPKNPNIYTVLRMMILLGPRATRWLDDLWTRKWPYTGQHPEFFFRIKEIVARHEQGIDRRLEALRTLSGQSAEVSYDEQKHTMDELLTRPQVAASALSKACIRVFEGKKEERALCRQLDILAYGQEIEAKSQEILDVLLGDQSLQLKDQH